MITATMQWCSDHYNYAMMQWSLQVAVITAHCVVSVITVCSDHCITAWLQWSLHDCSDDRLQWSISAANTGSMSLICSFWQPWTFETGWQKMEISSWQVFVITVCSDHCITAWLQWSLHDCSDDRLQWSISARNTGSMTLICSFWQPWTFETRWQKKMEISSWEVFASKNSLL